MIIQVFEHQTVKIGDFPSFTEDIWEAMIRFNDRNENRYFTIIHKGVKFRQYVGVIQIGKLTIEILPKADNNKNQDKNDWQRILIAMLKTSQLLKINHLSNANLRLQQHYILDLYFELFISETEKLLHQGLNKAYKQVSNNQFIMRGKLNFQKQIQYNIIHKNRFFTDYQTYNYNHLINQILGKTIEVLAQTTTNITLLDKLKRLSLYFPKVDNLKVDAEDFKQVIYNKKSERYRLALEIARLILLNYNPDLRGGKQHVLAILFDMNVLFETYIFQQLKKLETSENIKVLGQPRRKFWNHKNLKPDILIEKSGDTYVLDTKWKVIKNTSPSDEDLRQMYAYANIFNANKTIIIYPKVIDNQKDIKGIFHKSFKQKIENISCDLHFSKVIHTRNGELKLNQFIGKEILNLL